MKINFKDIKVGQRIYFWHGGQEYEGTVAELRRCDDYCRERHIRFNSCHGVQIRDEKDRRFCSYENRRFYLNEEARINKIMEI